ncbi:hypothetical protein GLOTRDRAFT_129488 [Gloeophyllum trabeum ATCC 11539]|uniref:F-box domain-containing protein n=1 Tax=Gloeophyllum trabeum (strain ATCC 11539 / FP-39264 / Madison 617) TaxID=670483 RepID=S7RQL9_GLOTA|nr:uncharacterized protein GLOTRDRAFT_129488 [Gloeophyllum trabeum ATCC 11539]EPQ55199.1 hypothetical protein GLOTRDRAFT_129488 [Gloeophyllum trabeum ATCC 11539]
MVSLDVDERRLPMLTEGHELAYKQSHLDRLSFTVTPLVIRYLPLVAGFIMNVGRIKDLTIRFHTDRAPFTDFSDTSTLKNQLDALATSLNFGKNKIQSLEIRVSGPVAPSIWESFFRKLKIPQLKEFKASIPGMEYKTLCHVLVMHPEIRVIRLSYDPRVLRPGLLCPTIRANVYFPIQELWCPPQTVSTLLSENQNWDELSAITLAPDYGSVLPAQHQWAQWLEDWNICLRVIGGRSLTRLRLVLGIPACPFPSSAPAVSIGSLHGVEHLILDVRHSPHLMHNVPEYLKAWLSSLTRVQSVTLEGHPELRDTSLAAS